jgi:hypothetical protein
METPIQNAPPDGPLDRIITLASSIRVNDCPPSFGNRIRIPAAGETVNDPLAASAFKPPRSDGTSGSVAGPEDPLLAGELARRSCPAKAKRKRVRIVPVAVRLMAAYEPSSNTIE